MSSGNCREQLYPTDWPSLIVLVAPRNIVFPVFLFVGEIRFWRQLLLDVVLLSSTDTFCVICFSILFCLLFCQLCVELGSEGTAGQTTSWLTSESCW